MNYILAEDDLKLAILVLSNIQNRNYGQSEIGMKLLLKRLSLIYHSCKQRENYEKKCEL